MKLKKVENSKGRTLLALLLDSYQEYRNNGYPSDPAVYVIRANRETVDSLRELSGRTLALNNKTNLLGDCLFAGFRLEVDTRLQKGDLIFGPETVEIKWSGD